MTPFASRRPSPATTTGPAILRSILVTLLAATILLATASTARADEGLRLHIAESIAPGVQYQPFTADTPDGSYQGHLIRADLWHPLVSAGLLYPGSVAATAPVSALADGKRAVAAINGDFFNIGQTGAPVGPAIVDGKALKAAVPDRQRHGPDMPPGYTNDDGFGITWDGRGVLTDLRISGKAVGATGSFELDALNQYAITVDGIGVFDHHWGPVSRDRAVCGTDTNRNGPCSENVTEVHVTNGRVSQVSDAPGSGQIARDTVVLLGRDAGATRLSELSEGDRLRVHYGLNEERGAWLRTAIGGFPIVADGHRLTGVDAAALAPRSAVGAAPGGRVLYLVAIEGRGAAGAGVSLASLADIMIQLGSRIAVNLDGGGSTTLVTRSPGDSNATVRNTLSGGAERLVPNALGIYGLQW